MECKGPVQATLTNKSSQRTKYKLDLVGVREVKWKKGGNV